VGPDIAQQLWEARQAGRTVSADALGMISDQTAAYALQTAMTTLSGAAIVGWKLGATSAASQKALGLSGPFYGPLLAPFCLDPGATVFGVTSFGPGGEGEFALVIGEDLAPRATPYTEDDVAAAVAAACPALEIAGTRLTGGVLGADPCHLIADDAANAAFIAGSPLEGWQDLDLAAQTAVLTVNGIEKGKGTGADALGGPLTALTWFVNERCGQGRTVNAGDIVTTGTCTGFVPLAAGDEVVLDCGALGHVSATVGEAA
jgi:2-keto-4-pentenoate hydratase